MLNTIISYSLKHQWRVVAATFAIAALGVWSFMTMKVDVLPDINKPTVAVFTEAEGFAPEEVERLVLAPVENAVAGAPGVSRVRGTASFGLAIVQAEFEWGSDVYRNRQIIPPSKECLGHGNLDILPDGCTAGTPANCR
jgi:HME family heavy-metal exporter